MSRESLLLAFLLLLALFGFFWLTSTSREEETSFSTRASTFRSDPHGTRALFLLTRRLGLASQRLHKDPRFLPSDASFLFLLAPHRPSRRLLQAYLRWLEDQPDRTLLLAYNRTPFLQSELQIEWTPHTEGKNPDHTSPEPGLSRTPPRHSKKPPTLGQIEDSLQQPITFPFGSFSKLPPSATILASFASRPMIVLLPYRKSRILLFSSYWFLSNDGLPQRQNLALISQILHRYGEKGLLLFDEYHHGYAVERGVVDYLASLGLQPFLFHLLLALLLLLWWGSSRPGPDHPTPDENATPHAHPIAALAGLYTQAKATPHALQLLLWDLHTLLRLTLSLPSAATPSDLPPYLQSLPPSIASEISSLFHALHSLRLSPHPPTSPELLLLAQRIDAVRLSLLPQSR